MIMYNITILVDDAVAEEWQSWMKSEHLPEIEKQLNFQSTKLFKILDSPNEGQSFSLQFIIDEHQHYLHFKENYENDFTAAMYAKYPKQLLTFSTVMEHIR